MFGYLLISDKNNVILVDGDNDFKRFLGSRIEQQIYSQNEIASTSSGIFTDSNDSLNILKFTSSNNRKVSYRIANHDVSHIFLPLITLFRGSSISENNIEIIGLQKTKLRFQLLSNNYIIIGIGNNEKMHHHFMDYFKLGININLGPLLGLIESDLLPVMNTRENIRLLVNKNYNGLGLKSIGYLDVRRASFYSSQIEKVFPLIKSISSLLHLFIGSNRCILMCKGDVLASVNSSDDDKQLSKHLCLPDVQLVLDQIYSSSETSIRGDVTQFWIRPTNGTVPFYVNVIRFMLSDNLTLVCLLEAKFDSLIRILVFLLIQLDQVVTADNLARCMKEMDNTIDEITKHLIGMVSMKGECLSEFPFLRNPSKTANFLKTIWMRMKTELSRISLNPIKMSMKSPVSIASLRSAFSSLSLDNAFHSTKDVDTYRTLPLQCEVLLSYMRRQVTTILQELCHMAHKEAHQYKLTLFRDSVGRIFKQNHIEMLRKMEIGGDNKEQHLTNYLRPIDLQVDMLSYSLYLHEKRLTIGYMPESLQNEFHEFSEVSSPLYCFEVAGKSGKFYNIYQLTTTEVKPNIPSTLRSFIRNWLKTVEEEHRIPCGMSITVVFQHGVHKQLAQNQILKLTKYLLSVMQKSSKMFL